MKELQNVADIEADTREELEKSVRELQRRSEDLTGVTQKQVDICVCGCVVWCVSSMSVLEVNNADTDGQRACVWVYVCTHAWMHMRACIHRYESESAHSQVDEIMALQKEVRDAHAAEEEAKERLNIMTGEYEDLVRAAGDAQESMQKELEDALRHTHTCIH